MDKKNVEAAMFTMLRPESITLCSTSFMVLLLTLVFLFTGFNGFAAAGKKYKTLELQYGVNFSQVKQPFFRQAENSRLSPQEQEMLKRRYERWQKLSPQHKEMLRRRQQRWEKMSPREQELYRQRYHQLQQLKPRERRELQDKLRNWENLTPREKEQIRQRFKNKW